MATAPAALAAVVAIALASQTAPAAAGDGSAEERAASAVRAAPARTIKERLSSKASDEQRVDNCKVPVDLRGPKPRPDDCRHGVRPIPQR